MNSADLRIIKWLESLDKENCKKFGKLYKVENVAIMTANSCSYVLAKRLKPHQIQSIIQKSVNWEIVTRWNALEVIQEYSIRKKNYSVFVREGMKLDLDDIEYIHRSHEKKLIDRLQAHFAHSMAIAKMFASVRGSLMAISGNRGIGAEATNDSGPVLEPTVDDATIPRANNVADMIVEVFRTNYFNFAFLALMAIPVQIIWIFMQSFISRISRASTYGVTELTCQNGSVSSETRLSSDFFALIMSSESSQWVKNVIANIVDATRDAYSETMEIIQHTLILVLFTLILLYFVFNLEFIVTRRKRSRRQRRTNSYTQQSSE